MRNPGAWGILVMAMSPLVPARLGPSWAGISLDDVPLLLGTALALWSVVKSEGWGRILHPIATPLWLFALWNGISVLAGGSVTAAEVTRGMGRWALFALAFSLLLRLARRGMANTMLLALIAIGLVEALFGLWAYLVDWAVLSDEKAHLIGLEMWRWYQPLFGEVPGRISGTLGVSSNFFGALMLVPVFLTVSLIARSDDRSQWLPLVPVAAAVFFGLVLTYTRASQIALLAAMVVFLALVWRWRVAGLVVSLIVAALVLTPSLSRFVAEANDRAELTEQALARIAESPITGAGSGNFVNRTDILIATPHNSFLLAASETGIVGGALLVVGAVLPGLYVGWEAIARRRRDPLIVGIAVSMLAFGIQTFSNSLLHIPTVAIGYWMVAAAGVGLVADVRHRRLATGVH
jgi:O-antigen ligase